MIVFLRIRNPHFSNGRLISPGYDLAVLTDEQTCTSEVKEGEYLIEIDTDTMKARWMET